MGFIDEAKGVGKVMQGNCADLQKSDLNQVI